MKRRHFEALRPICPLCQIQSREESLLTVGFVAREEGAEIVEGALRCTRGECLYEYPIIDGIPILVADPRTYVANSILHLLGRDDLSGEIESMLGECSGPGSSLDVTRQHLSNYTWDHYGEFDPGESQAEPRPGSLTRALERGLGMFGTAPAGPVLDTGCSVGRSTFDLARRSDGLVLGIDLNFSMLRMAASVMRKGVVRYARRRVGLIYDRREFPVRFENVANVDFWACDVALLPFAAGTFSTAVSLNLLDCVASPLDQLKSLRRVLGPGARLLLAAPYDWSGAVASPEAWIGGHSPRSAREGRSEAVLRALLTPGAHPVSVEGLRLVSEMDDVPWQVRVHDRSTTTYRLHLLTAVVQ